MNSIIALPSNTKFGIQVLSPSIVSPSPIFVYYKTKTMGPNSIAHFEQFSTSGIIHQGWQ